MYKVLDVSCPALAGPLAAAARLIERETDQEGRDISTDCVHHNPNPPSTRGSPEPALCNLRSNMQSMISLGGCPSWRAGLGVKPALLEE